MSLLTKKKYSFISRGMDKETFTVISFKGFEAISKPYEFEILLVSDKTDVDPLKVLQNPAILTIHRDGEENVDFNGILIQFEETQEFDGYLFFKAILSPKLWWLSLTHHNQVFLDSTVPEIMENALKDGGLVSGIDFEFRLQNTYAKLEYICQYDESHFDFVSRWAQREGLYYFFEQTINGEKVVFTDTKISHKDLLLGKDLVYSPPSGLDSLHTKEVIKTFLCKHNLLPQRVYLKDYNYLKPSQAIEGIADVDENGRGENYIYGVHFDTPEDGNRLAKIRAEALLCRKSIFNGESSVPYIVPGYTFDLNDHYKDNYNKKYLVTDVTHSGHQTGYLVSGISTALEPRDEQMFYANTFASIYSDEQFRPEHTTQKPRISGTINAKIDAAASGEYAELDEHGRYKVILPFDRSGRFNGKASAWFRMMQPYAGQNQGMHFPLHKGTEVLLTFIDGNPDRPIIAGAIPNPETSSPVTGENQTKSVITTGKNQVNQSAGAAQAFGINKKGKWKKNQVDNFIEFEDKSDERRIRLHSKGNLWFESQDRYGEYRTESAGDSFSAGAEPKISDLLDNFDKTTGSYNPTGMLSRYDSSVAQANFHDNVFKNAHVHVSSMDTVSTQEGNMYDFGGYWNYNLGNAYIENHMSQEAALNEDNLLGDLLNTGGPGWCEGTTHGANWKAVLTTPTKCQGGSKMELWDSSASADSATTWRKKHSSSGTDAEGWKNIWVEKTFGDTYEYTKGNTVSIVRGNSQTITFDGREIEEKYNGDGTGKKYFYKSGSGRTEETKWNYKNGKMLSTSLSTKYNGGDATKTDSTNWKETTDNHINYAAKASADINFGASASTSLNFAAKTSFDMSFSASSAMSIDVAAKLNVGISVGASVSLSASAAAKLSISADASLFLNISAGAGIGMEIEAKPATLTYKVANGKFKWHGPGTKLEKEAALKAKADTIILDTLKAQLGSHDCKLISSKIRLEARKLGLKEGFNFHL